MRLSQFLRSGSEDILNAWDEFAGTVTHTGAVMDARALRDHAGQILSAIADDLDRPQTAAEQKAKSRGEAERDAGLGDTAAETHADTRIEAGFAIDAMITEYRALRASVLQLWAASKVDHEEDQLEELTRFNEAIDQAITESVARYMRQVTQSSNLFMAMLGHDIRNPLSTILMSAEVLKLSGKVTAEGAAPIINGARRIQGIIDLIIDFAHANANGVMPVKLVQSDLKETFRRIVDETLVRHPTSPIVLTAKGDFKGMWDEGRMGQLLSNLLENAVTYGSRRDAVTVTMTADADQVQTTVHNTGRAIPPESRERIFDPRQRGTGDAERRAPSGLGLGLYICREIVRAHGGTLSLRSDDGNGTTFLFTVPKQPAHASEVPTRS